MCICEEDDRRPGYLSIGHNGKVHAEKQYKNYVWNQPKHVCPSVHLKSLYFIHCIHSTGQTVTFALGQSLREWD